MENDPETKIKNKQINKPKFLYCLPYPDYLTKLISVIINDQ